MLPPTDKAAFRSAFALPPNPVLAAGRGAGQGAVQIQCRLCPAIIVEPESFHAEKTRYAMGLSMRFFGTADMEHAENVCGACFAKVLLWCLDNRPDLLV